MPDQQPCKFHASPLQARGVPTWRWHDLCMSACLPAQGGGKGGGLRLMHIVYTKDFEGFSLETAWRWL